MLPLDQRPGLPDALRILMAEYPRAAWAAHDHFHGLAAFWMDRHLDFRAMTAAMRAETEAVLEGDLDPQDFASRLSRRGTTFLQHLHGHHMIEDSQFFPQLSTMEPRLSHGFDLLEADHQLIDLHLAGFVTAANAVLTEWRDPDRLSLASGGFLTALAGITALLDRHLTDEEELVVPVILRHGPEHFG